MKEPKKSSRSRATTLERRENELISLAVDLAAKQLAEGTASSSVITHYLKLGTTRERLEQERLRRENNLMEAKVQSLESMQRTEALYQEAIKAMGDYSMESREDSDV